MSEMTQMEEEVLRILNGEDVPGWSWGAAMGVCCEWLKDSGYAKGMYEITQKGRDYLAAKADDLLSRHPAAPDAPELPPEAA